MPIPSDDTNQLIIKDAIGDQQNLKVLDAAEDGLVIYTALTGGIAEQFSFSGTSAGVNTRLLTDVSSSTGLAITPAAGSVFTVTASTSNPVAVTFSAENPLEVTSSGNGVPVTIKNSSLTINGTLTGITNTVTVTGSLSNPIPVSYASDLYTDTVGSKKRLIVKAEDVSVTVTEASVDYKDSYYAGSVVTTDTQLDFTSDPVSITCSADSDTKNLIVFNLTDKDLLVYVGQQTIPAFLLVSSASYECNPVDSKLIHYIKTKSGDNATGDVYITRTKV